MAIYVKVKPTGLIKGSGKKLVDETALHEFSHALQNELLTKKSVEKDPVTKKDVVVNTYELDIDKMNPKPATGFSLDTTITEIFISVVGNVSTVGLKISAPVSVWKQGAKGDSAFGFLTSSGKTQDSGTSDQKQALFAGDVAKDLAKDIVTKVDGAIKNKLKNP